MYLQSYKMTEIVECWVLNFRDQVMGKNPVKYNLGIVFCNERNLHILQYQYHRHMGEVVKSKWITMQHLLTISPGPVLIK